MHRCRSSHSTKSGRSERTSSRSELEVEAREEERVRGGERTRANGWREVVRLTVDSSTSKQVSESSSTQRARFEHTGTLGRPFEAASTSRGKKRECMVAYVIQLHVQVRPGVSSESYNAVRSLLLRSLWHSRTARQHLGPVVRVVHLAEVGNALRVVPSVEAARFAPLARFEREEVTDDLLREVAASDDLL